MIPIRIISICPSNTELLAYLGCLHDVVGVDDYSDWPPDVRQLPRLGPDLQIDMDAVEKLQPDVVVASLSVPGMERNIAELQRRQIPYLVLNPNSLQDIAADMMILGKALQVQDKAQELVEIYHSFIRKYNQLADAVPYKPSLYWEWWPKPVFTPGKTNWLTEISSLAGAQNVFSTEHQASVQTDWTDVKEKNPDHICMVWVGVRTENINPAILLKRPGWSDMHAIQHNNVHVLEESLYCRPSPRLLLGLKKLAPLIHPHLFPPFDGKDPLLEQE